MRYLKALLLSALFCLALADKNGIGDDKSWENWLKEHDMKLPNRIGEIEDNLLYKIIVKLSKLKLSELDDSDKVKQSDRETSAFLLSLSFYDSSILDEIIAVTTESQSDDEETALLVNKAAYDKEFLGKEEAAVTEVKDNSITSNQKSQNDDDETALLVNRVAYGKEFLGIEGVAVTEVNNNSITSNQSSDSITKPIKVFDRH